MYISISDETKMLFCFALAACGCLWLLLLAVKGYWRGRKTVRIRNWPEPKIEKGPASGFFACPVCGLLADNACNCPECSDVVPVAMKRGDPLKLHLYIQRRQIYYGSTTD